MSEQHLFVVSRGRKRTLLALAIGAVVLFGLTRLSTRAGEIAGACGIVDLLALGIVGLPVFFLWLRTRFLWRLRNKLILTYLLIGAAPIMLFLAVFALASYVAVGQFAIHLATTRLEAYLTRLEIENYALSHRVEFALHNQIPEQPNSPPSMAEARERGKQAWQAAAYMDGQQVQLHGVLGHSRSPLALQPWITKVSEFRGIVRDGNHLYLAVVNSRKLADGRTLVTVGSDPVDHALVESLSTGLGGVVMRTDDKGFLAYGGSAPPGIGLGDISVHFNSSIPLVEWEDGSQSRFRIAVQSRPSLLYAQLFDTALSDTTTLRYTFFAICVFCALLEWLALRMAIRLNNTITDSVEGLYEATLRIDQGDLSYRIQVGRTDQMADLCNAFNRMSSSLERLLLEQQEKERLQSEISIAQEVQANLFPVEQIRVPSLELHGVCRPARAVSGDYYDFLVFRDKDGPELSGVGIALGDISGKGISAALLMATLHSAVRAYRFTGESFGRENHGNSKPEDADIYFHSPGKLLALLNRHLYRSTQPEKYATLFLAHYDVTSHQLTYSNAGHLPPILIRANGDIVRLTAGGTVVGLIDHMRYDEERQPLGPGDLLVAFSDGVTEPENDFGEFGEERLLEVVQMHRQEPLEIISARVMEALDAWIGAEEQPDDITLVLARGI